MDLADLLAARVVGPYDDPSYVETHYLQFDGVSDDGVATGALASVTDGAHAVLFKTAAWLSGAGSWQHYGQSGASGGEAVGIQRGSTFTRCSGYGYNAGGAQAWGYNGVIDLTGGPCVAAAYGSATRKLLTMASAGATLETQSGATSYTPKVPADLFVGRHATPDAFYGAIKLIAACALNREPTPAEVAAWSVAGVSPLDVWGADEVVCAYNVSDATEIDSTYQCPDLGLSGVPLVFTSLSDSDKVAL